MLPLPEALFLLALHDDRGTVHPAAYIALDQGLRAAVLGELRARKRLRIEADAVSLRSTEPTGEPLLDQALALLADDPPPPSPEAWLARLEEALPEIREQVIASLVLRGVLQRTVKDLPELDTQEQLPTLDRSFEGRVEKHLRETLLYGGDVHPWTWHLISLVSACNLIDIHFASPERELAQAQASQVCAADPLGRAVAEWSARVEGTWEF